MNLIELRSFCPHYIEFNNQFFSCDRILYKDSSFKLGNKSNESNGLTFMIWINSNASNRSKLFNLFDLHTPNDKKQNFLKIYFLNKKLYLKFLDQIEMEIILKDFFNSKLWNHFTITLSQSKEKAEISIYQNGLFIVNQFFIYKKVEINMFIETMEMSIGFDAPLKRKYSTFPEKIKEELEYFRVGPFLFFEECFNFKEINLLYSIMDSTIGTINFIKKEHTINFNKMTLENFKNLDFSFVDLSKEIAYSKIIIKYDLFSLLNSLLIETDFNYITLVKTKEMQGDFYVYNENNKKVLMLINKAERTENSQGMIINESIYSDFLFETFNSLKTENLNLKFIFDIILSSLEKVQNSDSFIPIFRILMKLCELYQEEIQNDKIIIILELLKQKKDFLSMNILEELFQFFCKKVKTDQCDFEKSRNYMITNVRNFQFVFMDSDFYRIFLRNSFEIMKFLRLLCDYLFNSKENIYEEYKK